MINMIVNRILTLVLFYIFTRMFYRIQGYIIALPDAF